MADEERIFIAERFGREGNEKNLEQYKSLSDELRKVYRFYVRYILSGVI